MKNEKQRTNDENLREAERTKFRNGKYERFLLRTSGSIEVGPDHQAEIPALTRTVRNKTQDDQWPPAHATGASLFSNERCPATYLDDWNMRQKGHPTTNPADNPTPWTRPVVSPGLEEEAALHTLHRHAYDSDSAIDEMESELLCGLLPLEVDYGVLTAEEEFAFKHLMLALRRGVEGARVNNMFAHIPFHEASHQLLDEETGIALRQAVQEIRVGNANGLNKDWTYWARRVLPDRTRAVLIRHYYDRYRCGEKGIMFELQLSQLTTIPPNHQYLLGMFRDPAWKEGQRATVKQIHWAVHEDSPRQMIEDSELVTAHKYWAQWTESRLSSPNPLSMDWQQVHDQEHRRRTTWAIRGYLSDNDIATAASHRPILDDLHTLIPKEWSLIGPDHRPHKPQREGDTEGRGANSPSGPRSSGIGIWHKHIRPYHGTEVSKLDTLRCGYKDCTNIVGTTKRALAELGPEARNEGWHYSDTAEGMILECARGKVSLCRVHLEEVSHTEPQDSHRKTPGKGHTTYAEQEWILDNVRSGSFYGDQSRYGLENFGLCMKCGKEKRTEENPHLHRLRDQISRDTIAPRDTPKVGTQQPKAPLGPRHKEECQVCGSSDSMELKLRCDGCHNMFHRTCLGRITSTPLPEPADGEALPWYCSEVCLQAFIDGERTADRDHHTCTAPQNRKRKANTGIAHTRRPQWRPHEASTETQRATTSGRSMCPAPPTGHGCDVLEKDEQGNLSEPQSPWSLCHQGGQRASPATNDDCNLFRPKRKQDMNSSRQKETGADERQPHAAEGPPELCGTTPLSICTQCQDMPPCDPMTMTLADLWYEPHQLPGETKARWLPRRLLVIALEQAIGNSLGIAPTTNTLERLTAHLQKGDRGRILAGLLGMRLETMADEADEAERRARSLGLPPKAHPADPEQLSREAHQRALSALLNMREAEGPAKVINLLLRIHREETEVEGAHDPAGPGSNEHRPIQHMHRHVGQIPQKVWGTEEASHHFRRLLQPWLTGQRTSAESFPIYILAVRGNGKGIHNHKNLQYYLHPMSLVVYPAARTVILADPSGCRRLRDGAHAFISMPLRPKGTRRSDYPYHKDPQPTLDPEFIQTYWAAMQPPTSGPIIQTPEGSGQVLIGTVPAGWAEGAHRKNATAGNKDRCQTQTPYHDLAPVWIGVEIPVTWGKAQRTATVEAVQTWPPRWKVTYKPRLEHRKAWKGACGWARFLPGWAHGDWVACSRAGRILVDPAWLDEYVESLGADVESQAWLREGDIIHLHGPCGPLLAHETCPAQLVTLPNRVAFRRGGVTHICDVIEATKIERIQHGAWIRVQEGDCTWEGVIQFIRSIEPHYGVMRTHRASHPQCLSIPWVRFNPSGKDTQWTVVEPDSKRQHWPWKDEQWHTLTTTMSNLHPELLHEYPDIRRDVTTHRVATEQMQNGIWPRKEKTDSDLGDEGTTIRCTGTTGHPEGPTQEDEEAELRDEAVGNRTVTNHHGLLKSSHQARTTHTRTQHELEPTRTDSRRDGGVQSHQATDNYCQTTLCYFA